MMLYIRQCNGQETFGIKINDRYFPLSFAAAVFIYKNLNAEEISYQYKSLPFERLGGKITYIELIEEVQNELSVDAGRV